MNDIVPGFEDMELYLDENAERKGDILIKLAKEFKLSYFVETGTYTGEMVKYVNARHKWKKIYTIELSHKLYNRAVILFKDTKNVTCLWGDSGSVLKSLEFGKRSPALFWLDAHYCEGVTARGRKITPLIEELEIILNDIPHVIVIDDLDNLPKWGINRDYLQKFIMNKKPTADITIVGTIMIVRPKRKV